VNYSSGKLLEAFNAIRQGEFEQAFELSNSQVKVVPDNFWAWYFAAIALGFLNKREPFQHYLDRANLLNSKSPYIVYLRAYTHLWNRDLESALIEWTSLIDREEGWLAKSLIEKARKGVNLFEKADRGEISFFIVLPDSVEGISKTEQELISESFIADLDRNNDAIYNEPILRIKKGSNTGVFTKLFKYILIPIVLIGLVYTLKNPVLNFINKKNETNAMAWKNFKIDEWAALVNPQKKESIKYIYKSKDKLIDDFEQAKTKLSDNKFNQARFFLQRIIYSNADFKTKEKSKIFLSFIPEPDYQDFSDPVFPDKLLETPEFYADCLVLWQGSVIKIRDVDHGKEVSLLIKDAKSDYLVDAFLQTKDSKSNWLSFSDFQKKKELTEKKPQAIVYGKFKGVIGNQKKIYLELIQLWM